MENDSFAVTQGDIKKIDKSATSIFHLLRHFMILDHTYTDQLIGKEYEHFDYAIGRYVSSIITQKDIDEAFKIAGSKFFSCVPGMEDPEVLIDTVRASLYNLIVQEKLQWVVEKISRKVECIIPFKRDIGYLGALDLDDLSDEERKKVQRVERGGEGVMINVLNTIKKVPTKNMAVILNERFDTGKLYFTAYPGFIGGPILPSASQDKDERKKSEQFWNKKVFLK